jgi:hypothetical protein
MGLGFIQAILGVPYRIPVISVLAEGKLRKYHFKKAWHRVKHTAIKIVKPEHITPAFRDKLAGQQRELTRQEHELGAEKRLMEQEEKKLSSLARRVEEDEKELQHLEDEMHHDFDELKEDVHRVEEKVDKVLKE